MTMDAWEWSDPARVLERKHEAALRKQKACTGCVNRRTIEFQGVIVQACAVKRAAAMHRCEFYKKENE